MWTLTQFQVRVTWEFIVDFWVLLLLIKWLCVCVDVSGCGHNTIGFQYKWPTIYAFVWKSHRSKTHTDNLHTQSDRQCLMAFMFKIHSEFCDWHTSFFYFFHFTHLILSNVSWPHIYVFGHKRYTPIKRPIWFAINL